MAPGPLDGEKPTVVSSCSSFRAGRRSTAIPTIQKMTTIEDRRSHPVVAMAEDRRNSSVATTIEDRRRQSRGDNG